MSMFLYVGVAFDLSIGGNDVQCIQIIRFSRSGFTDRL